MTDPMTDPPSARLRPLFSDASYFGGTGWSQRGIFWRTWDMIRARDRYHDWSFAELVLLAEVSFGDDAAHCTNEWWTVLGKRVQQSDVAGMCADVLEHG